jgi:4,4'-diaponeurosporenoate glycosyltransferase
LNIFIHILLDYSISIAFLYHLFFWILGFLFLFRISLYKKTDHKANALHISVIIPARNEEKNLPNLLSSLKDQQPAPHEIIVVDDYSEDKTKVIAEQHGSVVIASQPCPAGSIGKTWACYQGAQKAKGDILVFLDADTHIEKDGLKKIINTYIVQTGVISIQPFHKMIKLYEELSAFFNIIVMAAMGSFTILGEKIKPLGLFGPVVVIEKQQYDSNHCHGSVNGQILENLAFGDRLKHENIKVSCYGGKGTISFRMYPNGIHELITGWSKGFALGASKTSIDRKSVV